MNTLFAVFLFYSLPFDSICIRVNNQNVDTIEMNTIDPVMLQAFVKFKSDTLWVSINLQWHLSESLINNVSIPAPLSSNSYMLDLISNEIEFGFVWISIDGFSKTDTLFVHVNQCPIKNKPQKKELFVPDKKNPEYFNLQGKRIKNGMFKKQLIITNKVKILNIK